MTPLPGWAKVVVRKVAALGIVCGFYAVILWAFVQEVAWMVFATAALTALLMALLAYNERYGEPLYQEW